jgi:NADH:ubiquinone oxidoreductase subunit 6 (subunit J)
MITIIVIGAVAALAMFAILMKLCAGEPKETEKLQKGDIIKQLLALSELESGAVKTKTPVLAHPPQTDNASQTGKSSHTKAIGRTTCLT